MPPEDARFSGTRTFGRPDQIDSSASLVVQETFKPCLAQAIFATAPKYESLLSPSVSAVVIATIRRCMWRVH